MGIKLKIARIEKGYDKAYKFAEKIGITRQYLTMLETGKAKNPSKLLMKKISTELGISVEELFFTEEN